MRPEFIPVAREALIEGVASAARQQGARILVQGVHGLGATFTLQQIGHRLAAGGVTLLRATGSGVSVRHQLFHDVIADIDMDALRLPSRHRGTIEQFLAGAPGTLGALSVALEATLKALSSSAPLVLVIDDAHLLDPSSSTFVEHLMSRPSELSLVLSGLAHSSAATSIGRISPTSVAALLAVDVQDLARIVHSRTGIRPSRMEAARIHLASCGNPGLALSLLGAGPRASDRGEAVGQELDAPSLELIVVVVGAPGVSEAELRALPEHAESLSLLLRRGVLRSDAGRLELSPPGPSGLDLGRVDPEAVRRLHARLAIVRSGLIGRAEHLDRALLPGPSESVATELTAASSRAWSTGDGAAAAELMLRSLARSGEDAEAEFDRRASTAAVLFAMGEFGLAANVTDPIRLAALGVPQLDRVLVVRAAALSAARGELVALAEIAALIDAVDGDPVRLAMVRVVRAVTDGSDHSAERIVVARAVLETSRDVPRTRHRATAAIVHASIKAGSGMDEAAVRELTRLERELPELSVANGALAFVGMHAYQVERLDLARSSLEAARRAAQDRFEDVAAGRFAVHLALVETYAGRLADADAWLTCWDAVDPAPSTPPPAVLAARLLLALLRDDTAAVLAWTSKPTSGNPRQADVIRLAIRGRSACRHEDFVEACILLTSARALASELHLHEPGARLHLDFDLARAQIATGRDTEARATIADLERISAGTRPLLDGVAARLRGLMAHEHGRPREAVDQLLLALRVLPRDGFAGERASTSLDLAGVLIALGDVAGARAAAMSAQRSARAAGDVLIADRVDGLDLRDHVPTPKDLLSPREFAVSLAVSAGRTNREIAADNWISVRTVETQLSAAYRKLGVRTRAELAVLLHDSTRRPEVT